MASNEPIVFTVGSLDERTGNRILYISEEDLRAFGSSGDKKRAYEGDIIRISRSTPLLRDDVTKGRGIT